MPDIFVAPKKEPKKKVPKKERLLTTMVKLSPKLANTSRNPLSAFLSFPDGVKFETQRDDETIILLMRPHLITNVPWITLAILLLVAPAFLPLTPFLAIFPIEFQLIIVLLWYLLTLSFVFEKFLGWFFNIFVVTDQRVIDIDFYSLTYKEVSEAALDKIQDLTYKTGGALGSIIDFGFVYIQTAGTEANIEFENVPHPGDVISVINQLIQKER